MALLLPYSPELNPVEPVWLYLRERFLSLRDPRRHRGAMSPISVEIRWGRRRWLMMLCCLHDGLNGTVGLEPFSSVPGEQFGGWAADN